MKKLTASVVGGGMGGKLSLRALADSNRFDLIAAADLSPDVCHELESLFPAIRTFPNHDAMLQACPTDVVCVSTYPPSHEAVTLAALRLPLKGILVEKPLGHTASSGRRILAEIRRRNLPMAVPHGLVARRAPLEIIERVQRGEIGALKLVEIQCRGWDIINAGIHWLDFFVTLIDREPVAWVMALCDSSARTYRDGMQVETIAVTYAQTLSGIRVVMNTGDYVTVNRQGKDTLFRLVGTGGIIEFWGWEDAYLLLNAEHPGGITIRPEEYAVTGHRRHLEAMADQIAHGEPDYRIAEASLLALEICEAAYLSSRHRRLVELPLHQFVPPPPSDWSPGEPYAGTGGGRNGRKLEG